MKNKLSSSHFVISLDFELLWGVIDSRGEEYYESIEKVHVVIPKILELFGKYQINCTWAMVGALMADNYDEFIRKSPVLQPSYNNKGLSPYFNLDKLKLLNKKLLFAPDLIKQIVATQGQELASHTYSHYYCLENGQTPEEFSSDLRAWSCMAEKYIEDKQNHSLVFPRNQFGSEVLKVCKDNGIKTYRGNPEHWAYKANSRSSFDLHKRIFRLLDTYLPLSGSLGSEVAKDIETGLFNIPASLFFRPYNSKLKILERFKIWRIKYSLEQSAKNNKIFHLWWHPHNFSTNTSKNLEQLVEILEFFKVVQIKYGMKSSSMFDVFQENRNN